uniref:Cytochrome P450 n=1 Tax=Psilocybe cubensis TaxID=181762 RepID=A0A8H7XP64_PSICU
MGLLPYGDLWRRHRKLLQQCFRRKISTQYEPIQTAKTHNLLNDLLRTPSDFIEHCKKNSSAMIMSILYGQDISDEISAQFVSVAEETVTALGKCLRPGKHMVSYFPILRYLPAWFPGADFQRRAAEVKKLTCKMKDEPVDFVGKGLLHGTASASLVADLLENCYVQREYDLIKDVAATSFAAGAETSAAAMESFLLAMSLFPEAQKKAQAEIDRVIGKERLPTTDDRPFLPYIEAVYRELMRWAPILPLNTDHTTTADDIYKGYYIPKGTVVYANTWALTRNEEKYPNPDIFNPDRFFTETGHLNDDDTVLTFGFGRRICPGRHMASTTVWLAIVSILANFDIKGKGTNNKDQKFTSIGEMFTDNFISRPVPFECDIVPRKNAALLASK